MPFSLKNSPTIFTKMIDNTLALLLGSYCIAYMDNILIFSLSEDQHKFDLEKVLLALSSWLLVLKRSRCKLFKQKVTFLGTLSLKTVVLPALIDFWLLSAGKNLIFGLNFAPYWQL